MFFFSKSKINLGSNPEKQRKFRHRKRILTVFRVFFSCKSTEKREFIGHPQMHHCRFFSPILNGLIYITPSFENAKKLFSSAAVPSRNLCFFRGFTAFRIQPLHCYGNRSANMLNYVPKLNCFIYITPFFFVEHTVRKTNVFSTKSSVSTTNFSNIWNFWCSCQHFFLDEIEFFWTI